MEDIVNKSSENVPSKISSSADFVCGERKLFPRVGAEYQAEIPLALECDRGELTKAPFNGDIEVNSSDSFSLGLPVPVKWIYNKAQVDGSELIDITNNHVFASNQDDSVEPENSENGQTTLINGKTAGLLNLPSRLRGKSVSIASVSLQEMKANLGHCDGLHLVPGLPNKGWNQIEHSSFLLGLYIFGKNLALIKKFVGSKEMGDILSYYYGMFYKSQDYQRWSDSRKLRGRRCISGQRLFMGGRQQELLSRLSSCVSEECFCMLIKASKLLGDGHITLEEYVFSLRDKVGIENLVEAVAIGKGKRDLSGTSMDYTKTIQSLPVRPRLLNTKPCSSLTATEILKFLTGSFRLRRAQLNDLFWDAVWPRLLARGWHSEQLSDLVSAGTKQSLVFLVPDVNKFSRSLAKGTHFFNSISDVLDKVASEPSLLELEVNAYNDEKHEEKRVINPEASQLQRSYLQRNNSESNELSMKFTVVDTSLFTGVGSGKVWEMRSLPVDLLDSAPSGHLSEENHGSVSLITEEKATESITEVKPRFKSISEDTNLAVCSNRGLSHETENMCIEDEWLKEGKLDSQSILSVPSQNMSSDTSFSSSQEEKHVRNLRKNSLASEQSHKNSILDNPEDISAAKQSSSPFEAEQPSEMQESINIEAKKSSSSCEAEQPSEMLESINLGTKKSSSPCETEQPSEMLESINEEAKKFSSPCETEQQSEMLESINVGAITEEPPIQRRSSRNKPSARVLEAIAYGFIGAGTKRKRTNSSTSTSSSQRVRNE